MEKTILKNRLLLPLIFSFVFSGAFATEPVFYPRRAVVNPNNVLNATVKTDKLPDDPIWYEDFDGGLPEGWLNVDESGYVSFSHSFVGPQGSFSQGVPAINSTTASNGFMMLDSDLASENNPGGLTNAFIQSPAIDLSEQEHVMLSFQHFFRYCCSYQGTQLLVEVSNDGENWVSYDVKNGVWPNNLSQNAIHQLVNISEVAGGQPQVWIRFRKIGASHYFWMIDDVSINTFSANDLELFAVSYGGYTMVPGGHQQPVEFSALVRNLGGNTQTGVRLNTSVNTYLFNGLSAVHNQLASGSSVVLSTQPEFTFPGRGLYNISFKVTQNQNDTDPENNLGVGRVLITDTVYARDRGIYLGEGIRAAAGQAFITGNIFDLIEDALATSVSVALHELTEPGAEITAKIYLRQGNSFSLMWQSDSYIVANQDISSFVGDEAIWVTIPVNTEEIILNGQNKYLVAISYTGGQNDLIVSSEVPQGLPNQGAFTQIEGLWQTESQVPMIRLNLGMNVAECASFFQVLTTQAYCGTSDGQATVIPLTGFSPYTFLWETDPEQNLPTATNLGVGQYIVEVWDDSGCHDSVVVTIDSQNLEAIFESLPSNCGAPTGQATVIPLAGFEPYTFSWEDLPGITGPTATGLTSGTYLVLVTDNIGCQGSVEVQVDENDQLMVEAQIQNPVCVSTNGSILLEPLGGTEPFVFLWNEFPELQGNLAENLAAGTYHVTISDQSGCEGQVTIDLEFEENELTINSIITEETCQLNNASIIIEVEGAAEPIIYKWSTGASIPSLENLGEGEYTLIVTDAFGCEAEANFTITNEGQVPRVNTFVVASPGCGNSGGTALVIPQDPDANFTYEWSTGEELPDLENLPAGVYYVTVTNPEDNCQIEIPVVINDAAAPPVSGVVSPILCYGDTNGTITVSVAGAGSGLEYIWLHGEEGQSISDLGPGTYIVTVLVNECFTSKIFNLTQPDPLWIQYQFEDILCYGETTNISVSPRGGTYPFSFYWSNGITGTQINNIPGGNYWVQVTDFHECTYKEFLTISNPDEIVVEAELVIPDSGMENGSITLFVTGGTGQLSFLWNTGDITSSLTNLPIGTYSVVITDENGCTESLSFNLSPAGINGYNEIPVSLYPNPVGDQGWLQFENSFGGNLVITLHDISGRFVREIIRGEVIAGQRMPLDLSGVSQGVYILSINGPNVNSRLKLIKH